jgi:uncharacterized protein YdeI (YjbR/CyaY-like superfamily)
VRPRFFRNSRELRDWFRKNSARAAELWVGYYKRDSAKPRVTRPESVDQALCFGWIDGIRKRVDDTRYTIRFTPRRAGSTWSSINVRRMKALIAAGQVSAAGKEAFAQRKSNRSGIYSFEQRTVKLPAPYAAVLKKHKTAHSFFESQPAHYRKAATWWVVSAKQEQTRQRRLQQLIADSAQGLRIAQMRRTTT